MEDQQHVLVFEELHIILEVLHEAFEPPRVHLVVESLLDKKNEILDDVFIG